MATSTGAHGLHGDEVLLPERRFCKGGSENPLAGVARKPITGVPRFVIPAKAGIVRLKAHLVREVEVLFRYALSDL